MKDALILIVILVTFSYGVFVLFWPENARGQFLSSYDLDARTEWHKPGTWLKRKPSIVAFRLAGTAIIGLSLLVAYVWLHSANSR